MPLRPMTPAELVALREFEAAEQDLSRAVAAREAARTQLEAVTRRARRRESARAYLRVVRPSSVATGRTSRGQEERPWR
jgi:hypothetical protein